MRNSPRSALTGVPEDGRPGVEPACGRIVDLREVKYIDPMASRCLTLLLVFSLTIGLSRTDSVPSLTRRLDARGKALSELCDDLTEVVKQASAPAAFIYSADPTRTDGSRQFALPKTKNKA